MEQLSKEPNPYLHQSDSEYDTENNKNIEHTQKLRKDWSRNSRSRFMIKSNSRNKYNKESGLTEDNTIQ